MKGSPRFAVLLLALVIAALACHFPGERTTPGSDPQDEATYDQAEPAPLVEANPESQGSQMQPALGDPSSEPSSYGDPEGRIQPADLVYLGAFRLPNPSGGSSWDYSGHGLTYFPQGDPEGAADGYPGSLYGVGHDHQLFVSEISIPAPVNSRNLEDLNTVATLQPFADLTGGIFVAEEMSIPRAGIEYLPPQGEQTTAKLHFVWGQHIQDFEHTHGWAELDLSQPQAAGPWFFDGYTNYVTSDYLFEIPVEWAQAYAPGMRLATGRAREGLWSGRGPGLFAYAPWEDGDPPAPEATLNTITPLLLYGTQEPVNPDIASDPSMAVKDYKEADHWMGGAWLTAGERSAVIFVGTKALGADWYGFANGVVWPHDCAEQNACPQLPDWPYDNRGFWAEAYQAQMIFYDPAELAAVASGEIETWTPQPYASLSLQEVLYDPDIDITRYRRDLVGAAAFDRANGLLYVIERLADGDKSVVHVWRVGAE